MGANNYYADGQWNVYCDLCGKKIKSSTATKTWDNFYVCRHHKEVRNPQDFLRGIKDDQSVPFSRPEAPDSFVPIAWTRQFYETVPITEVFFRQGNIVTKSFAENITPSESFSRATIKALDETVFSQERYIPTLTKPTGDSVTIAETFSHGNTDVLAEPVSVGEARTFAFVKIIAENVGVTETILFPIATNTGLNNAALNVVPLG